MRIKSLNSIHNNSTMATAFGDVVFDDTGVAEVSEEAAIALCKLSVFYVEDSETTSTEEAPVEVVPEVVAEPVKEETGNIETPKEEAVPTTETDELVFDIESLRKLSNIELRKLLVDSGFSSEEDAKNIKREDILNLLTT